MIEKLFPLILKMVQFGLRQSNDKVNIDLLSKVSVRQGLLLKVPVIQSKVSVSYLACFGTKFLTDAELFC